MNIYIAYHFKKEAWGGGNQFLSAHIATAVRIKIGPLTRGYLYGRMNGIPYEK